MRLFKYALPILFVAGLALLAARAWTDQADSADRKLLLEHARHQFSQRAAVARAAPDRDRYRDDLRALLRSWFADVTDIGNRFPMLRGQPAPFAPPPPRVRGGDVRDWQELAESQVGAWREGKLEMLDSAAAQGMRLDLLRVSSVAGHLAVDVAVWGAPEEMQQDEVETGKPGLRVGVPLVFKGLSLRFFDAKGAVIARLDGAGEPALRLDMPTRLVPDAPPGLTLARYELPLFPPDAAEVEWTLATQVRAPSDESRLAQAVWKTKSHPSLTGAAWSDKVVDETGIEAKAAAPEGARPAVATTPAPKARHAAWPIREQ
ncbi:MAG: hypothetical protein ABR567_04600 [Myxococcales bacterium]|nr:hypothetical protein [Myxococcales bacterium]